MGYHRVPVCWLPFFMMFLVLIVVGCKQQYALKSTWLDREIKIDGIDKDWRDKSRYYDEKSNTRIAIYNDNDSLYLCLESMDPGIQMSILRKGLTIWLCETGKSETVWGLRYPYMAQGLKGDSELGEFDKPGGPGEPWENDGGDQNQRIHKVMKDHREQGRPEAPSDLQGASEMPSFGDDERNNLNTVIRDLYLVLDSEKEPPPPLTSDEIGDLGIFCKFTQKERAGMIFEIKIPLNRCEKTPYAARLSPEQIVSIGFITEKVADEKRRDEGGKGRGPGGGRPGGGGSPGGGPGGGPPRDGMGGRPGMGGGIMGNSRAEAMEIWANIELSSDPALSKR